MGGNSLTAVHKANSLCAAQTAYNWTSRNALFTYRRKWERLLAGLPFVPVVIIPQKMQTHLSLKKRCPPPVAEPGKAGSSPSQGVPFLSCCFPSLTCAQLWKAGVAQIAYTEERKRYWPSQGPWVSDLRFRTCQAVFGHLRCKIFSIPLHGNCCRDKAGWSKLESVLSSVDDGAKVKPNIKYQKHVGEYRRNGRSWLPEIAVLAALHCTGRFCCQRPHNLQSHKNALLKSKVTIAWYSFCST